MTLRLPFLFRGSAAALCGMTALLDCQSVAAAEREPETPARYQVRAQLSPTTTTQASSDYRLTATLRATQPGPTLQKGSVYTIKANPVSSPAVCFADTIFRDGFQ